MATSKHTSNSENSKITVAVGMRFGRLLVLEYSHTDKWHDKKWLCQCDCGNTHTASGKSLRVGDTRSCGCLLRETGIRNGHNNRKHGLAGTPIYRAWHNMIARCYDPSSVNWEYYGARGITVCERWHDFECFVADMGRVPKGKTLDRIDTNGNYSPENCRWSTRREQDRNLRRNVYLEYDGRRQIMADWAREFGIPRNVLGQRLKYGWSIERALTTRVVPKKRKGG